jgi:NAD(P)-dependent dehydrogenase (short-subunit alcohol dehydrogenase family)
MRYLVTGASGFIGKRLVRKLLAGPDNTVFFLVREASRAKLPALLAYWGADAARAVPLFGDLREAGLGLGADQAAPLANTLDHVFHLGAVYDLSAPAQAQVAANVDGTRNTVALVNTLGAGCLHHMSSIAAAGLYEGVFREDMFEEAEHLEHPYFATKHEGEKIARTECHGAWRIYRPGMVVGDSHSGEADKADGPYYFFKLIQRLRQVLPPWMPAPGLEGGRINIVPVDYVVDALHTIAHLPGLDRRCFHLTDPHPLRVGEVLDIFAHAAHAPRMSWRINARVIDWIPPLLRQRVMALPPAQRIKETLMHDLGLPHDIMQFVNYPTRFDNREAAAVLAGSGIACPPLRQYAPAIWDYWERKLDPALSGDRSLHGQVAGKVVLVTGGSSGIGLASAQKLAAAGAVTLICGRDQAKLAAASELIAATGGQVHAYPVDLSDMEDCDRFTRLVIERHGGVEILVNCAGRSIRRPLEASFERFHDAERTMRLNYFGALRVTMGLLPQMIARRSGQVVTISSIGVLTSAPRFSAYIASKAALEAWMLCAASELADVNIRFTIINMPLVRTPMIAPTAIYRGAPALAPEQAAEMVARAIIEQPVRIATRLGLFGKVMQTLLPRYAQIVMNAAFRAFPDSGPSEPGAVEAAPIPDTPEQQAMRKLLRGLHL